MPPALQLPFERALVIGLGHSGCAAARLLTHAGVEARGYDQRAEIEGLPEGLIGFLGAVEVPDEAFAGIDLLVLSPGIAPETVLERQRRVAPNATVHGEMSLALQVVRGTWPHTPTVLITGTNGKSTVTAWLGEMLREAGRSVFAGGNLGPPIAQMVLDVATQVQPRPAFLVLECSSYQLETFDGHPTDVAMILNVSPDHLSRYSSMEHYADTKARVFSGLGEAGLALLDAGDPWTPRLGPQVRCGRTELVGGSSAPFVDGDQLRLTRDDNYPVASLRLAGRHNAKNALFALAAAHHLGVERPACERALANFSGLPHRMQHVGQHAGVDYFDDSKATNVAAVLASLQGFGRRFVLVAGGQAKGDDLRPLRALLAAEARGLVAIGEAQATLLKIADGVVETTAATDMEDAVGAAAALAEPGDAVVLSPACASWDQYENFAARGRAFVAAVEALGPSMQG